jgi:subtilisin family serine protease
MRALPKQALNRMITLALLAIPCGAAWLAISLGATMGAGAPGDPAIEDQLAVRPALGHTIAQAVSALENSGLVGVTVADSIPGRDTYLLKHDPQPGVGLPQLEAILAQVTDSGIAAWAEVNYEAQTAEGKTDSLWVTGLGFGDWFHQQYAVELLGVSQAHSLTRGQGVVVALLDTGVDIAHPAIEGAMASGAWSLVTNSPNVADMGNGMDDDADGTIDEGAGHGSFVASLIRLVAPEALLLPIQVLDSEGRSDNFRVAKAMYYAIDHGAQVINMSLGTTYRSAGMEEAAAEAFDRGIIVVAPMGNYGGTEPREYPGSDGNAFGVAATDEHDVLSSFSSYGPRTDFCAPGSMLVVGGSVELGSAVLGALPGGSYGAWRGTSFAAAFATGTAALIRAQHPEWPNDTTPANAVVDAIMGIVAAGAVDISAANPGLDGEIGQGRIHAGASALLSPPAPLTGDLDGSGDVSGADLGILLNSWGACGTCAADLDRNGVVNGSDIGILLTNWS